MRVLSRFVSRRVPAANIVPIVDTLADGNNVIAFHHVSRTYATGRGEIAALDDVSFTVRGGEWVAIVGPSGSGKSTLMNLIAGIDRASSGEVRVAGRDLTHLSEERLARWRGQQVGIVFQFFQLMPTLTVRENVLLPMELRGGVRGRDGRALALLDRVGVASLADKLPTELSGGEQQRVAIARALANDPAILLADEPTGNLDSATGERVIELLRELAAEGRTLVIVTHDGRLAARAPRVLTLADGRIVRDAGGEQAPNVAGTVDARVSAFAIGVAADGEH